MKISKVKKKFLVIATIIGLNVLIANQPSKSFAPKVYQPNIENLKKTGLEIGYTAAHLIKIGQAKEGTGLAKVAISLNPEEIELWMILAEGQIRSNKLNEAIKSINKAKTYDPKIASLWFAEASIALNQKKADLAISSLTYGLKIDPNNSRAYFQLGNAKIMKRNFNSALKDFQKAFDLNNQLWQASNNEGLVLYELGRRKKAIKTWEKVLLIKEDAEPKLALAAALNIIKPTNEKSIRLTKEALEKSPNYIFAKYRAEQLWGRKLQSDTKKLFAMTELKAAIEQALKNADFENQL